jgi:hypothetical protein
MIDANVWGVFRGIGLSFDDIGDSQRALFNNKMALRKVQGCRSYG